VIEEAWAFKPAVEQVRALAAREVKPRELMELYFQRIELLNPGLDAYVHVTRELAETQASAAEQRLALSGERGALCGLPISLKESASLAGHPFAHGSRDFVDSVASFDSFVVSQLKRSGAVILGKTNAPEFGTRPVTEGPLYPPARNPWDRDRTAGGSTGGGAAAVAAGLCALAQGGDGGGSIRIPASCCGVVGLKPSRGRISSGPLLGEDWAGLATNGVIGRTVADVALGLDAMAGHLPGDPYWAEQAGAFLPAALKHPQRLRIGWMVEAQAPVDPQVSAAVVKVAKELERLGHLVFPIRIDLSQFRRIIQSLAVAAVGALPIRNPAILDPLNRRMFEVAGDSTAVDYLKIVMELHQRSRQLVNAWDQMDVLLTPTLTHPAPRIGELGREVETASDEFLDWLSFTHPFNCTGQPAISLPLAQSHSGLPIGIQLVGGPHDEYTILSLGAQLESVFKPRTVPSPAKNAA
jgi:amidase